MKRLLMLLVGLALSINCDAQTIQAENYTTMFGVQLETTTDVDGGQNVGYLDVGDWMTYSDVDIGTDGMYRISFRVSSTDDTGKFAFQDNGITLTTVATPNTFDWQKWTDVQVIVPLRKGKHELSIRVITRSFNVNWFRIGYEDGLPATSAAASPPMSSASSASSSSKSSVASSSSKASSSAVSSTPFPAAGYTNPLSTQWLPPTQRENGNALPVEEICCYFIRAINTMGNTAWESAAIAPGNVTSYLFTLPDSMLATINRFEIVVSDTNGLYSNYVIIQPYPKSSSSSSVSSAISSSSSRSSSSIAISSSSQSSVSSSSSSLRSSSSSSRKYIAPPTAGTID